jgi:DNA polymerase-3 subunit epsilon
MREVVLDTETTGFDHRGNDRIVEIGCIELLNSVPTGKSYQRYINPERDMPDGAFAVHGLSEAFLAKHPVFEAIVDEFLDFLDDSQLVIHNAEFDIGFINAELKRLDRSLLSMEQTLDTVRLARQTFPGAQASLDALCRRFQIDNSNRTLHGALKDADLLASVYLELIGGRQPGLELASENRSIDTIARRETRTPRPHKPTTDEMVAHTQFVKRIEKPIWGA